MKRVTVKVRRKRKATVVNKYREDYDVYIGRGSKWGNPFRLSDCDGHRDVAVIRYCQWLIGGLEAPRGERPPNLADIKELEGKRLGCFCAPKLCHGHVLAMIANGETEISRTLKKKVEEASNGNG